MRYVYGLTRKSTFPDHLLHAGSCVASSSQSVPCAMRPVAVRWEGFGVPVACVRSARRWSLHAALAWNTGRRSRHGRSRLPRGRRPCPGTVGAAPLAVCSAPWEDSTQNASQKKNKRRRSSSSRDRGRGSSKGRGSNRSSGRASSSSSSSSTGSGKQQQQRASHDFDDFGSQNRVPPPTGKCLSSQGQKTNTTKRGHSKKKWAVHTPFKFGGFMRQSEAAMCPKILKPREVHLGGSHAIDDALDQGHWCKGGAGVEPQENHLKYRARALVMRAKSCPTQKVPTPSVKHDPPMTVCGGIRYGETRAPSADRGEDCGFACWLLLDSKRARVRNFESEAKPGIGRRGS